MLLRETVKYPEHGTPLNLPKTSASPRVPRQHSSANDPALNDKCRLPTESTQLFPTRGPSRRSPFLGIPLLRTPFVRKLRLCCYRFAPSVCYSTNYPVGWLGRRTVVGSCDPTITPNVRRALSLRARPTSANLGSNLERFEFAKKIAL